MPLTKYQRFAYRLLGSSVGKSAKGNVHLRMSLQRAHIYLRPEVYLGYSYLNMVIAFVVSLLLVAMVGILSAAGAVSVPAFAFIFLIPLPLVVSLVIYVLTYLIPDMRASERSRDINAKLPYALNYISTMASAGVTPDKIFDSLSKQPIYGEVANEAAWISRDLRLLGLDLVTALTHAIDRSPSIKFQDLLQGAITAITSGEDLKHYFLSKSEQFVYENRQEQKKFLEGLGILAESYVTVVVAAPVFLIVLLSVMLVFGGNGSSALTTGYMLIFVLVPLSQFGFGATIKFMTPEV